MLHITRLQLQLQELRESHADSSIRTLYKTLSLVKVKSLRFGANTVPQPSNINLQNNIHMMRICKLS